MKAMFTAFVAIAIISVGAYYVLGGMGFTSQDRNAGNAVRLSDTDE
ncbi:hypothetical protein PEL8287_01994 [Roseovarius litorisediminis]|uniref:Uncharacterized protein n=1 Tax=Roseovarius litorisediminis TaxID=1312363 RepID=A0A1Y5SIH1_9RHOB|nr:hypothetical protein [Roseovarius litorisediminis]SLN40408.1 hypothetical protein PEL8287_01994 [Roseovarius litorisediminis]